MLLWSWCDSVHWWKAWGPRIIVLRPAFLACSVFVHTAFQASLSSFVRSSAKRMMSSLQTEWCLVVHQSSSLKCLPLNCMMIWRGRLALYGPRRCTESVMKSMFSFQCGTIFPMMSLMIWRVFSSFSSFRPLILNSIFFCISPTLQLSFPTLCFFFAFFDFSRVKFYCFCNAGHGECVLFLFFFEVLHHVLKCPNCSKDGSVWSIFSTGSCKRALLSFLFVFFLQSRWLRRRCLMEPQ